MFSAKQILDTQNDIFGNILGGASKLLEGIVDFGWSCGTFWRRRKNL